MGFVSIVPMTIRIFKSTSLMIVHFCVAVNTIILYFGGAIPSEAVRVLSNFFSRRSELTEATTLLAFIRVVSGSYLGRDTEYHD